MTTKLLRRPEVEQITRYSRSTIYRLISLGEFPEPIHLSKRSVVWKESDIQAWIDKRIEESKSICGGEA